MNNSLKVKEIIARGYINPSKLPGSDYVINPYVGCPHRCMYCYAEFMKRFSNHDEPWGTFVDVKIRSTSTRPINLAGKNVFLSSVTDCYNPLEEKYELTRKLLQQLRYSGAAITILTKSALVLRDLDLLKKINGSTKAVVQMTLTTFDEGLCRKLEPNVSTTRERFEALKIFREEGIPTVVWLCPLLPFINDTGENLAGILDYCAQAGVKGIICFGMGLTLRDGNREYFYRQLDRLFPGMKERYIRTYGNRYELPSPREKELTEQFTAFCREHSILHTPEEVFGYLNAFSEKKAQPELFDYVEN